MSVLLRVILSASLLAGCGESSSNQTASDEPVEDPAVAPVLQVHDLACGCALEDVGLCGNYIQIEGRFVELVGTTGLGSMPFCGKEGLKGEVTGELRDGKFEATSFKYADL
jgi:hypothetical protein